MRSVLLVLVMNITALFCVRCSESKCVLATVWIGTAGYITMGGVWFAFVPAIEVSESIKFREVCVGYCFSYVYLFVYPCI